MMKMKTNIENRSQNYSPPHSIIPHVGWGGENIKVLQQILNKYIQTIFTKYSKKDEQSGNKHLQHIFKKGTRKSNFFKKYLLP